MADSPEYNQIADQYIKNTSGRIDREEILIPSAEFYLGGIEGKEILDLACGDGYFARHFKKRLAKRVVGADISIEMIDRAKKQENLGSPEILYHVVDVSRMKPLGKFDYVFAGFLLHYSKSASELEAMAKAIFDQLKIDGKFVAFNENPYSPIQKGMVY